MSDSSHPVLNKDDSLESSLNAFWESLASGESPKPESWATAHPELGDELRKCLDVLRSLHDSCAALREDSKCESASAADATHGYVHPSGERELLMPGTMIGRCRIERLLGRGGMGEIYLAVHETLECQRAVKVLQKFLAANDESAKRFLKEVKALGKIGAHQNIVAATHADQHVDGRLYLEMEYWPGADLAKYVSQSGPLSVGEACKYMRQVAEGLDHLHKNGVIHRDIKPSNLLRTPDGTIKILDLGLAKLTTPDATWRDAGGTHADDMLGTFDYISPEQADDPRQADERSDLYSLGCTFYFLLTARAPFAERETRGAKLIAHMRQSPPPLNVLRKGIPRRVSTVVEKLLAKDPDDRYETAEQLVKHLNQVLAPRKQMRRLAVGIDLGTTYSVIAYVDHNSGRPMTLRNEEGELTTPSTVLIDHDETIVGKEAVKASQTDPERVAVCAKRLVGMNEVAIVVDEQEYAPEVVQALVLKKLASDAGRQLRDVREAVISVPAHFDEVRRRATFDAAYMAGIDVLDILNEPTAAALACGVQQGFLSPEGRSTKRQTILVYDLGGGTFDVTVMSIDSVEFITLATDGDVKLGGHDWDQVLIDHVAESYLRMCGDDPRLQPRFAAKLRQECEDAKRTLSKRRKAFITCDFGNQSERFDVTREEFEKRTRHLLERTEFTTRDVVRSAGLDWSAIDRIVLVGGSTRMPMVRDMLERVSGRKPELSTLPEDEAVAHGAALYADLLLADQENRPKSYRIQNVNSHCLGVVATNPATDDREVVVVIPRNTPLPASRSRIFRTAEANQKTLVITVVEGESSSPENCTPIGDVVVRDLPPHLPARSPVQVIFGYRENGRLQLAVSLGKKLRQEFQLECKNGMPQATLDNWRLRIAEAN